jgi:DNA-binding NarL/FixJ family response regulator
MRHPLVVIFEGDGRLAALLRPIAEQHNWVLREPRQTGSALRVLQRGGPAVLVIKAGRDLDRELALLERVKRLLPEAAVILVGDVDHPALAGLAWDLGADFVLFPPQAREQLPEIVDRLMNATGGRQNA